MALFLAILALLAAANAQNTLSNCDDCCTPATALSHGAIYMDGSEYEAFSVCSNGYILLLRNDREDILGYSYNPTPISQTEGSDMIAGFWSDVNLRCSGTANTVHYEEIADNDLLVDLSYSIDRRDSTFTPTSALVVVYDKVQRYTCPGSHASNSFTIIVITDAYTGRTYLVLDYGKMEWNKATTYYHPPTVGYSNGHGQGFMADLGSDPVNYLNEMPCGRLIYRIDENFAQEREAQVNRGNLAHKQERQDKGVSQSGGKGAIDADEERREAVIMQEFEEKNDAAMQDKLTLALQEASRRSDVIIQHFEEKN